MRRLQKSYETLSCQRDCLLWLPTYIEKSKTKCSKHSIREDRIIAAVLEAIQREIKRLGNSNDIAEQVNQSARVDTGNGRIKKMLHEKQQEIDRVQALKDGLYEDWKAGDISREDHKRMKTKYEKRLKQLVAAITALKAEHVPP